MFRTIAHECRGKIVSTIGHFHGGEKLEGMRELRVFEKEPKPGDLPAHMEERLLPSSDIVIITGMALTNHTMSEILRYSQGCKIILTGPSVPLSEVWFEYGVSGLFGTFVWNVRQCHDAVFNGGHKEVWASMGKMVIRHKEI